MMAKNRFQKILDLMKLTHLSFMQSFLSIALHSNN